MKNKIKILTIVGIVIILFLVVSIISILVFKKDLNAAVDPTNTESIVYEVKEGENALTLSQDLENSGIIQDSEYFYNLYLDQEGVVYANFYSLSPSMTSDEIYSILNSPSSNVDPNEITSLLIYEGETIPEIADSVASLLDISSEEVLNYWSDSNNLNKWIEDYEVLGDEILNSDIMYPLEGYLYPATYQLSEDETLESLTTEILNTTESNYAQYIGGDFKEGFTFHQILTLASIVERETMHEEDRAKVAGVFYNRLEASQPLQSDITVLYAMGEYKADVLYEDLEYESPYNTYLNSGLPPSPISSVSISALEGTITPEDSDYFYFFATQDTGEIIYSKTYDEHLEVADQYAWEE